jgi:apolipoprotein N-acyltransferase
MIISGAESYETYDGEKKRPTISARFEEDSELWWDAYNTAISFKEGKVSEYYHKSKLVPGVEKMPFSFLEQLSIDLGGTSGSLGTSKKPINFQLDSNYSISPLICYESIYGDYVADFVRQGANMLAVITNDAWWGNTDGHKQHLLFGAIRCIETRKEMVRSANTGISAKINKFGEITTQTKYNELTAFECNIRPNNIQTFYVKYGNILGKMASFIAIALLLGTLVKLVAKKGY